MITVANQRRVNIQKEKNGKHTAIQLEALQKASQQLSGEGFKMWLYFAKNQDNYTLALSKANALYWGIGSESSYYRAIKELINQGYLQKSDNSFIFYELSK